MPFTSRSDFRHSHNLNDQTGPASKMLRPLSLACRRIILLPCEARILPAFKHSLDEILSEFGVNLCCAGLLWAGSGGDGLGERESQ